MKKNFLLILIFGGLILAPAIFAQVSIGISPLVFEITGNPGDVIENQVKIYNPSDVTISIRMTVEDIAPTGEAGHVVVEPAETETYSIAKWTKSEPEEFVLKPKEEKWVKFTISIPENAEPGGHYGTIVAGSTQVVGGGITGAVIVPRVGTLVLLVVPGQMEESLIVKDLTAPKYSEYGPINFAIRFENEGTVHVKPKGQIVITNWLGKKVGSIPFPERNVLPEAIRKFEASWDKKWLWAGRYTATLTGSYGMNNLLLTPTVITFWAFPWKIGLVILAIIVFIILSRKRWLAAFKILIKGERVL
ncbi:hypothetical protein AMJ49_03510 [Parcubacteria bacterium DG_74_2]|nr:MAG: hypothetical protein AMJ49_03510 [Parcubacteria bacterium DG_74_2]